MEDNYEKDPVFHAECFSKLSFMRKVDRFEDILESPADKLYCISRVLNLFLAWIQPQQQLLYSTILA